MGFKVNTSFLKYLTMGALGSRKVSDELRAIGFKPIELERYCYSNKIWSTKVKRLRIADLICVNTGLRVEVRAKSKMAIRMSDAPSNPDRAWDAGLRDIDVIALIACSDSRDGPVPSESAVYFEVQALRKSVGLSSLGLPKSASEGAERDRTWPATVPTCDGEVLSVSQDKLVVQMSKPDGKSRKQTYDLTKKTSYVRKGDRFTGNSSILAGAPKSLATIKSYLKKNYNPLNDLSAKNSVDRYAGAKSIRFRHDLHGRALPLLEKLISEEPEKRVALEAAGTASALGSKKGEDFISTMLWNNDPIELSMESILILTEIGGDFAKDCLIKAAGYKSFTGDERRQAAIWGLGKAGIKSYLSLIPYLSDREDNVVLHAIAAFGQDTPRSVIKKLIGLLAKGNPRESASASEALRFIGSEDVLFCLLEAEKGSSISRDWVIATIGKLNPDLVTSHINQSALFNQIRPMLLTASGGSWLASDDIRADLTFLSKQRLSIS